jgi:multisubunit Na+/H+ antiporter MnhB subunit
MSVPADRAKPATDWTIQTVDTIDSVVSLVRDKATVPIRTVARVVVYGVAIFAVVVVAAVLIVAGGIRALTVYLPVHQTANGQHRVWVSYLIIGAIFTLFGLFFLGKAEAASRKAMSRRSR